jgi:uncharacterized protein (TIGR02118 family)
MTLDEFRHWATVEHPAYAHAIPGLAAYVVNVIAAEDPHAEFHVVTEVWFSDEASFQAAFATDAGKAAAADAAAMAAHRVRFAVAEHKVI